MHFASFGNALTLTYSRLITSINFALNNNNVGWFRSIICFSSHYKSYMHIALGMFPFKYIMFFGNVYSNVAFKL